MLSENSYQTVSNRSVSAGRKLMISTTTAAIAAIFPLPLFLFSRMGLTLALALRALGLRFAGVYEAGLCLRALCAARTYRLLRPPQTGRGLPARAPQIGHSRSLSSKLTRNAGIS